MSGQQLEPSPWGAVPQALGQPPFDFTRRPFVFDGGAGSYIGISILATLLTAVTLGIAYPWAMCMRYRWKAEHTLVYGRRVRFNGHGGGLFGSWIAWLLLCVITIGIYGFWVAPRLTRWIVEHQEFS